jgi:hypothetical protein
MAAKMSLPHKWDRPFVRCHLFVRWVPFQLAFSCRASGQLSVSRQPTQREEAIQNVGHGPSFPTGSVASGGGLSASASLLVGTGGPRMWRPMAIYAGLLAAGLSGSAAWACDGCRGYAPTYAVALQDPAVVCAEPCAVCVPDLIGPVCGAVRHVAGGVVAVVDRVGEAAWCAVSYVGATAYAGVQAVACKVHHIKAYARGLLDSMEPCHAPGAAAWPYYYRALPECAPAAPYQPSGPAPMPAPQPQAPAPQAQPPQPPAPQPAAPQPGTAGLLYLTPAGRY